MDAKGLTKLACDMRIIKANSVASTCWLFYVWASNLEDEIRLIWKASKTPPTYLYFISRYFGLAIQLTLSIWKVLPYNSPQRWIFQGTTYEILNLCVEMSLAVRVVALWRLDRKVIWLVSFSFFASLLANLIFIGLSYPSIINGLRELPESWPIRDVRWYNIHTYPSWYSFVWVPILLFETELFILNTIQIIRLGPSRETPTILRVFRDGTLYYIILVVMLLLCSLSTHLLPVLIIQILDSWVVALFSFAGSELLLSIRVCAEEYRTVTQKSQIPTAGLVTERDMGQLGSYELRPVESNVPSLHDDRTKRGDTLTIDDATLGYPSFSNETDIEEVPRENCGTLSSLLPNSSTSSNIPSAFAPTADERWQCSLDWIDIWASIKP